MAELRLENVHTVRMPKTQYLELFEFGFQNFRERLTDERRHLVETFVIIKRMLKENDIRLEVVEDA